MSSEQTSATGSPPPTDHEARLTAAEVKIRLLDREFNALREAFEELVDRLDLKDEEDGP